MVTLTELKQSYDCPGYSEETLKDVGNIGLYQNKSNDRNSRDWKLHTDFIKTYFFFIMYHVCWCL